MKAYLPPDVRTLSTPRRPSRTKLGQGNIFRSVCQQFCPRGGRAWLLGGGVVLFGGRAWFYYGGVCGFIWGGMHGFIWGACVVLFGGVHGFIWGARVVLFGGMRGFIWGGVCGFFQFFGYNEIRSMSGRYASYWNAFLYSIKFDIFGFFELYKFKDSQ